LHTGGRNSSGKECGKIIYESKRTKTWNNNWLEKLKTDKRSRGADIAILVTQVFPKDMERFGKGKESGCVILPR
jgi:hypothetical protein